MTTADTVASSAATDEGFVHCSYRHQVGPTLRRFFSMPDGALIGDLVVLEIDPFLTGAVIRAEAGTGVETLPSGEPELFPHLYGKLPRGAVVNAVDADTFLPSAVAIDGYTITDDRSALSVDIATSFLAEESYWARGRSRETVAVSLENSWVFTVVAPDGSMAGMARVISDWATMYYLSDLFILPEHRGRGIGSAVIATIVEHPRLKGLKGLLRTVDAHELYERFGFERDGPDARGMRRPADGAEPR